MANNFSSPGKVIQYTASADIASGQVIAIGEILGVALVDIPNGGTGAVAIEGIFRCPKVSAAVIGQGESLVWDVSANDGAGAFDDNQAVPATGDISGPPAVAAESAGNGVTTLLVKLTGVPGTVKSA